MPIICKHYTSPLLLDVETLGVFESPTHEYRHTQLKMITTQFSHHCKMPRPHTRLLLIVLIWNFYWIHQSFKLDTCMYWIVRWYWIINIWSISYIKTNQWCCSSPKSSFKFLYSFGVPHLTTRISRFLFYPHCVVPNSNSHLLLSFLIE